MLEGSRGANGCERYQRLEIIEGASGTGEQERRWGMRKLLENWRGSSEDGDALR